MLKFLLALVVAFLAGCVYCNDCDTPASTYRYLNRTGFDARLLFQDASGDIIPPSGSIPKNDSVEFTGRAGAFLGDLDFHSNASVRAEIRFLTSPPVCLIFSGMIVDSLKDPRSRSAYGSNFRYTYFLDSTLVSTAQACP